MRAYAVFYLAFLYGPVLFLPLFSVNDSIYISFPMAGFTLDWYRELAVSPALLGALANSLTVAGIAALVSTSLGALAARAAVRYRFTAKRPVLGVIMLPIVLPEIVMAIGLLILLSRTGALPVGVPAITFGHIVLCTPFATAVLMSRYEGFDPAYEEASLDLGEDAFQTFWRVTFPMILPGIVASLLLTFTISFDEFIIAFFISGTDPTLPVYIWSQLRFPNALPVVLALGSVILVVSFILVAFAEWFRRRGTGTEAAGMP